LTKDAAGRFGLTADSAAFLVGGKAGFLGGLIRHTSTQLVAEMAGIERGGANRQPAASVNREKAGAEFFHDFVRTSSP